jgi:8-oxo-dGTP diphosphatase
MPEKRQIVVVMGVVKQDDKILLTLRDEEGIDGAHMKWELPGGKLEFGEDPEKTVVREIKEETGYDIKVKNMIPITKTSTWDYPDHKRHVLLLGFECECVSGEINKEDGRIKDVKWFKLNDIDYSKTLKWTQEFIESSVGGMNVS